MYRALVVFGLLTGLVAGGTARAGELIMFEQAYCDWCEAWDAEVGHIYAQTDEGKLLPLRRVDIHETLPTDLAAIGRVRFTPTFVVMEEGREVGRIQGYPGEDSFYWLLGEIIARMANPVTKVNLLEAAN